MPLQLYSIHEARDLMEERTDHSYDIEAVRKAVRQRTLICFWMGQEPVFTEENIMDYLRCHGRYKPKLLEPTDEEV